MSHKRLRMERETLILFNDEDVNAVVYSASPRIIRQLTRKLGKGEELSADSFQWSIPKNWIKLPTRRRKKLSEEHKKKLSDALSRARKSRQKVNTNA